MKKLLTKVQIDEAIQLCEFVENGEKKGLITFDNYMDTEDRTGALLHRNPKLQRETNVLSRNHIDGPHNSVIYHHQHVARRRRREKVSLFSKPWAAYPSVEDRQKEEIKIIKDGFKKRRMLL